jgi:hypothetical protein
MQGFIQRFVERLTSEVDPHKDRSTGLAVFGAIDIVVGIFYFSLAMLLLIVVSSTGLGGMKPVHYHMAMGFLFFLTAWFIVMGLGSIKARRWARALLLIGAWVAVFFGTLMLALVLYILPELYNVVFASGFLPPEASLALLYAITFVLVLSQVIYPLGGIAFYGLKSVQATCERISPEPSWTDRFPLPLLAMGFISVLGSLSIFFGVTTNYTVFLFGHVANGLPGMLLVLVVSVACGYVGWGALTRRMHAWWGAYALVLLTSSSMMLTFSEMEVAALYAHMGYSASQITQIEKLHLISPATLTFASCLWGIMACIYLAWVRDCFRPERVEVEVKSYQRRKAEEAAAEPPPSNRPRMRLD